MHRTTQDNHKSVIVVEIGEWDRIGEKVVDREIYSGENIGKGVVVDTHFCAYQTINTSTQSVFQNHHQIKSSSASQDLLLLQKI